MIVFYKDSLQIIIFQAKCLEITPYAETPMKWCVWKSSLLVRWNEAFIIGDDIFVPFESPESSHSFHEYMSSKHQSINFFVEQENVGSLSFLDIKICRKNGKFVISIYRKPVWWLQRYLLWKDQAQSLNPNLWTFRNFISHWKKGKDWQQQANGDPRTPFMLLILSILWRLFHFDQGK